MNQDEANSDDTSEEKSPPNNDLLKIIKKQEELSTPSIFLKRMKPPHRTDEKTISNYKYGTEQIKFTRHYVRPVDASTYLPYYQRFCNEIRRADGIEISSSATANKTGQNQTFARAKLISESSTKRIKKLKKHFSKAKEHIENVENKAKKKKFMKLKNANNKTINARLERGLKELKVMETELDKDVTNEILVSAS